MKQKSFNHVMHYFFLLLVNEFIFGTMALRKKFIGRFIIRLTTTQIYSKFSYAFFRHKHSVVSLFTMPQNRAVANQNLYWSWAISGIKGKEYLYSWTRSRYSSPKVIIMGAGSVGDALQITPLIREMHRKLPSAEICLLHRSLAAKSLLHGNPFLKMIEFADIDSFMRIKHAVERYGFADLVVEIQTVRYFVSYTCAPEALRHPEFNAKMPESFFVGAKSTLIKWQNYSPIITHGNNKFACANAFKKINYLDILGLTSGLLIDRYAELDLFLDKKKSGASKFSLENKRFVTIQNGVDLEVMRWGKVLGRLPTKMLPFNILSNIVASLCHEGVFVVQIGVNTDELIHGVSRDLRGTTLHEAATILKHAACHIGTEGGLVHLARAMQTKSVVLFGPTSAYFFGYPQNLNLTASDCSGCSSVTKDWYISCPRGDIEPECMSLYRPENVVNSVLKLIE